MAKTAEKVAVSLDGRLLERAERLRRDTGESRSALIGRALSSLVAAEEHQRRVQRYLDAYREIPETLAEESEARALARQGLASVLWDDA